MMKKDAPTNPRVIIVGIVLGRDAPPKIGYMPIFTFGLKLLMWNNALWTRTVKAQLYNLEMKK